jgi:CPA2 family monovalent cation:H+ antiporter-2
MIRFSPKVYEGILRILPEKWIINLNNYASSTQNIQAESNWKKVFRSYLNIAVSNGIILLALMLLSLNFLQPFLDQNIENDILSSSIGLLISFGAAAPFIWALIAKRPGKLGYKELWLDKEYSRGPLLVLEIARVIIGLLIMGFWVNKLFSAMVAILIAMPLIVVVLMLFSQRLQRFYQRLEGRFLSNFNAREIAEEENAYSEKILRKHFKPESELVPWEAHMVDMQVDQNADFIGKNLEELAWREKYGVNIAYIKRGDKLIYAPSRFNKLLPFDHVGIISTDEQMQQFKPVFDATEAIDTGEYDVEDIVVQKIVVDEHNKLKGHTVRNSGIRERTNGLIIGIERNQERILNPNSQMVFEWGDIVWIVGERKKIQQLNAT